MILAAAAQFAWANAQEAPADMRMIKMELTATQLAHYMAPGVNLGNTMEACNWNDIFTNNAGLKSETSWQNDKTSESYIRSLKKQGFNSLRIPTSWVAGHLIDKQNMNRSCLGASYQGDCELWTQCRTLCHHQRTLGWWLDGA